MDPRLKLLSYSSLLTLHACPKKYQLYKLQHVPSVEDTQEESLTFLFGHTVGEGIQHILQGLSYEEAMFKCFLRWDMDLFAENPKQKKSFWAAMSALQQFYFGFWQNMSAEWELVVYNGKPAVELSFVILLPDGFKYRGFVDAVLKNKITGEVRVLEIKTTSSRLVHPAMYKNSSQALGYAVVLDHIFPGLSSYEVLYLPYKTLEQAFEPMSFNKTTLQRALWIAELSLDVQMIQTYEAAQIYPTRGESCYNYFRECPYFGVCNLDAKFLTTKLPTDFEDEPLENFDIVIAYEDLVKSQLRRIENA